MTRSLAIALVFAIGATALAGDAHAQATKGWSTYRNEKFGLRIAYPGGLFKVERTSEAGDGQVLASKGGEARLLIGALINESGFSPESYMEHIARESYGKYKISYRRAGRNWFVLSGEGDGKMFYEKVMFSCSGRLINSFAVLYPSARRDFYDPLVEVMEDTFRPGNECERAGVPLPKHTPKRASSRIRPAFANAPRDPVADRIARQRGHDVYVILRSTTPPYERKVVRGYASR